MNAKIATIALVHNTTRYLSLLYGDLIRALLERGFRVITLAPFDESVAGLRDLGVDCVDLPVSRHGINPLREFRTVMRLRALLARERPDVVFLFSAKPIIYGSIAARLAGISRIMSMVTGLGYAFTGTTVRQRILRCLMLVQYRLAFCFNRKIFFQNPDDRDSLLAGRSRMTERVTVLSGGGVNVERFVPVAAPARPKTFLLIARLLWDKGIREYVEATRRVRDAHCDAEFWLLGPYDDNPAAVTRDDVESWQREGLIRYLGTTDDVRPLLAQATAFVLPSYREGTPRAVLEALAMGKPVITTDVPGCRETVDDGGNGYLVPSRDAAALAAAMIRLLDNPALTQEMGRRSRRLAVERFDVRKVNDLLLGDLTALVACT